MRINMRKLQYLLQVTTLTCSLAQIPSQNEQKKSQLALAFQCVCSKNGGFKQEHENITILCSHIRFPLQGKWMLCICQVYFNILQ